MTKSSRTFISDAPGVDPRSLELLTPFSEEVLVAAINQAIPPSPPCADDLVMCPDLVSDDGSSQLYVTHYHSCYANASETKFHRYSSTSPPSTPQSYYSPSPPPQLVHNDPGSFYTHTMYSSSPTFSTARVLTKAPCAGGRPIKQEGGYSCSSCGEFLKRRDDVKRHMGTAGVKVTCKYCGKSSSARRDGQLRHLKDNKKCRKAWEAGYKVGRFTERTVEDAYN